jgi:hypothetical protein
MAQKAYVRSAGTAPSTADTTAATAEVRNDTPLPIIWIDAKVLTSDMPKRSGPSTSRAMSTEAAFRNRSSTSRKNRVTAKEACAATNILLVACGPSRSPPKNRWAISLSRVGTTQKINAELGGSGGRPLSRAAEIGRGRIDQLFSAELLNEF